MVQLEMIDNMAQMRRKEINREVFGSYKMQKILSRKVLQARTHLDLNVRLVLQPRFSLSIWLGRGA